MMADYMGGAMGGGGVGGMWSFGGGYGGGYGGANFGVGTSGATVASNNTNNAYTTNINMPNDKMEEEKEATNDKTTEE